MKLYKNVCIGDLARILKEGIQPISVTGNNNWAVGKRVDNPIDIVYLFNPLTKYNTFTQYGMALLEVDIDDATEFEMSELDANRDKYIEYVTSSVAPEDIKAVYLPEILKLRIEEELGEEVLKKIT